MIDSHTHLDMVPGEAADAVEAAREAGVRRMLTVGTDPESCRWALRVAEEHPGEVFAAVGRHPNQATGFDESAAAELAVLAAHPACRAIGETGLDYHWDKVPRREQARAFALQVEVARRTAKPLVIHTREAADDTITALAGAADGLTVILHCFSMPDRLDECLDHGWWVSLAGNVTYPRNTELADAAGRVPLDRLLLETDAPFLSPQPVRKHRNQPAYVVHTARFVAERQGVSYAELEEAVDRNAAALFGW